MISVTHCYTRVYQNCQYCHAGSDHDCCRIFRRPFQPDNEFMNYLAGSKRQTEPHRAWRTVSDDMVAMWLAWSRDAKRPRASTTASTMLGGSRIQETTRLTNNKLDSHMVMKDLQRLGLDWKDVEAAELNKQEYHRSVAQCVHMEVDWNKIKVVWDAHSC